MKVMLAPAEVGDVGFKIPKVPSGTANEARSFYVFCQLVHRLVGFLTEYHLRLGTPKSGYSTLFAQELLDWIERQPESHEVHSPFWL